MTRLYFDIGDISRLSAFLRPHLKLHVRRLLFQIRCLDYRNRYLPLPILVVTKLKSQSWKMVYESLLKTDSGNFAQLEVRQLSDVFV